MNLFQEKTIFITGASRGIGQALAYRLAKEGANIVICAKTDKAHPKLKGTIHETAEKVRELGGKALPIVVDIREEKQIQRAVTKTVETFGGLDILINNASAISLTNTEETTSKAFDLMFQINVRGSFLCTQACLPYLKRGKNSHILNLSPPISLKPLWFKDHMAYTMSKYCMSMSVLGLAEELKADKIAVNALWPKTTIATSAVKFMGGEKALCASRKPDIVCDAAHFILQQDSSRYSGQFLIDEDVLRSQGISNFDSYAVKKGIPPLLDLYMDESFQIKDLV